MHQPLSPRCSGAAQVRLGQAVPVTRKKDFLGLAPRLQTNHITGQPTNVFVIGKNRKKWAPVVAPGKYPRLLWGEKVKVSYWHVLLEKMLVFLPPEMMQILYTAVFLENL